MVYRVCEVFSCDMVYKGQKQTYNVQEMPTSNFDLDTNYST
jgi:hypothetical protein